MMKNKKMGILAVLVMLVAITLNAVGGTYAKYISAYSMTDEARVAKWDFRDVAINEVDLFEASYTNDNGVYVASSDASKVIAPGTNGEYNYDITGTAETNFQISGSTKIVNKVILATGKDDWNKGELLYDPIEFSFDGGTTWSRLSDLGATVDYDDNGNAQLVYEESSTNPTVYAANTVLKAGDVAGSISWRWAFEADENNTYSNDTMDTKLGTDVVNNKGLTITAAIGTTVVQTEAAPTAGTTKKPVTLSNKINRVASKAEDNAAGLSAYGMNTDDTKDVIFNGIKLSGTIKKNDSALAKNMFGDMASGYYYALVLSENAARVEFTGKVQGGLNLDAGSVQTLGWNNVEAGDALTIGLYNSADKTENKFTITVKDVAGDVVQEIEVDYSELNFAA